MYVRASEIEYLTKYHRTLKPRRLKQSNPADVFYFSLQEVAQIPHVSKLMQDTTITGKERSLYPTPPFPPKHKQTPSPIHYNQIVPTNPFQYNARNRSIIIASRCNPTPRLMTQKPCVRYHPLYNPPKSPPSPLDRSNNPPKKPLSSKPSPSKPKDKPPHLLPPFNPSRKKRK